MGIIINPTRSQGILADPTLVRRNDSGYSLYVWTFLGIEEYRSSDLENWAHYKCVLTHTVENESVTLDVSRNRFSPLSLVRYCFIMLKRTPSRIVTNIRPFILSSNGNHYLAFERRVFNSEKGKLSGFTSEICITSTNDFEEWEPPRVILNSTEAYPFVSAPCIKVSKNRFELYFSYGNKFTGDTSLMEPEAVGFAESNSLDCEFTMRKPVEIINIDGSAVNQVGGIRYRHINGSDYIVFNSIQNLNRNSFSQTFLAKSLSESKFQAVFPLLTLKEHAKANLSNTYLGDFIEEPSGKLKMLLNARFTNPYFDKFRPNKSAFAALWILVKSLIFSKEVIMDTTFDLESHRQSS